MSFGDDAPAEPLMTTRVAKRYRVALEQLRDAVDMRATSLTPVHRAIIHDYITGVGCLLAMGFEPTEQLTLDEARRVDGIAELLDDSEPAMSSERDQRPAAAE